MNKYIKPILFFLVIILAMIGYSHFIVNKSANDVKKLINIDNLSKDFMTDYFEEVSKLDESSLKYSLIVTSLDSNFEKYGASNVIEGPNHQFLLSYNSKDEMNKAKERLTSNQSIIRATENIDIEMYADTHYSWGIDKSNMGAAINYIENGNYDDVTVAVIDSGCNLDEFNTYYEGRIKEVVNLYDTKTIYDESGHGTHVSGIIADATPSNVSIIPIKIGDNRALNYYLLLAAFNYVIYYDKADVINLSLGSQSNLEDLYVEIVAANDKGIITVAAAGNGDGETPIYPASYDNTISVSSVDSNLNIASTSNYGNTITFSAPGVNIRSVNGFKSGTSMATPHVSSAVAMLKSVNKDVTYESVVDILKNHSKDLGDAGWDKYYGYGFLDLTDFETMVNEALNIELNNFEAPEEVKINYNYGNETNLMNLDFVFYDGNGKEYTKKLSDIDGLEITGYDPFSCNTQNVEFKFQNNTKEVRVKNNVCEINAYQTESVGTNEVSITGIVDPDKKEYIKFVSKINNKDVVSIGQGLFLESNIKKVILPSSIKTIGESAFADSKIEYVNGDANDVIISANAFNGATYLRTFSPSIKELGDSAFYGARLLNNIKLSNELTKIPDFAFYDANMISDIDLTHITEVGDRAFSNTSIRNLYIPKTLATMSPYAFLLMPYLETIEVENGNPYYDSRENSNNLIKTSTNELMVGSSNSFVPDSIKVIRPYAFFSNHDISEIYTNNVTSIGQDAFGGCLKLETVIFGESLETIGDELFTGSYRTIVYAFNSKFKEKLESDEENKPYGYININPTAEVIGSNDTYTAFDTIGNISLNLTYDGFINEKSIDLLSETINSGYRIEYESGNDSFRYGDTHYNVIFTNKYGVETTKEVPVTINKKNINYVYTSSGNIVKKDGQAHGINLTVDSPSEAKIAYMDQNGNYTLTNMPTFTNAGTYTINYKIYIDENYNEVYGSETVTITENTVNYSTDYAGIYDGNNHTINLDIRLDNYTISYSLDNINYNLSNMPEFNDVGEHIVYYKINSTSTGEVYGSNKVKIYGVKNISSDILIKENGLILKNNSFNTLTSKINIYADRASYKHYDSNNSLINSDAIKTGDRLVISISGKNAYDYDLSMLGDMTGDGKINSADLLRMRQHLIGTKTSQGVYFLAGDINNDSKLNSGDLLRLRQHLIGTKVIS